MALLDADIIEYYLVCTILIHATISGLLYTELSLAIKCQTTIWHDNPLFSVALPLIEEGFFY